MMTHLLLPLTAGPAFAAVDIGVHRYQLTHLQILHAVAKFFDDAGKLVTEDYRRGHIGRALAAVVDMHISAADAAGGYPHQHLSRTRVRQDQRPGFNGLISKKICANH